MKTTFTRIFTLLGVSLAVSMAYMQEAKAQDLSELLQASGDDAEKLVGVYTKPFFDGFGYGLTSGWYNTAAPHKFPGFDLTINANLVTVPEEGQFFDFLASEYSSITGVSSNGGAFQPSGRVETLFGPGETESTLQLSYEREVDGETYTVDSPIELGSGFGVPYIPVPVIQLGVGLPKNTDLKVRYLPSIETEDFNVSLFGIGILHDFKQWIPGLKTLPFDASVLIGYTKFSSEIAFLDSDITDDGTGEIGVRSLTYQLLVSKKLSVLTVYAGFGANSIKSNVKMLGTYNIQSEAPDGSAAELPITDPIDLDFSNGGGRATIGARLKLAIITFHADYSVQRYNTLSAGIGISVR